MDTNTISLEEFYGDPEWETRYRAGMPPAVCGVPRTPNSRITCTKEMGHLPVNAHRGYDRAMRIHSWRTL